MFFFFFHFRIKFVTLHEHLRTPLNFCDILHTSLLIGLHIEFLGKIRVTIMINKQVFGPICVRKRQKKNFFYCIFFVCDFDDDKQPDQQFTRLFLFVVVFVVEYLCFFFVSNCRSLRSFIEVLPNLKCLSLCIVGYILNDIKIKWTKKLGYFVFETRKSKQFLFRSKNN